MEMEYPSVYCKDRWYPLRNESPIMVRRTASFHDICRTHGTTVVGVVRSLRRIDFSTNKENGRRCRVTFSTENGTAERSPSHRLPPKAQSLTDGASPSVVPSGYMSCQRLYRDAQNSWLPTPKKGELAVPLVFRTVRKERQQTKFWNLHQEILSFKSAAKFIRLLRRTWKRLFPSCHAVTLEECREILQGVLQTPVSFSELYFVFSLICEQATKELSIDALEVVVPRLFLPREKFDVLVCQHIGEIAVWPAFLCITYDEVESLLQNVCISLSSDVSGFVPSMVEGVLDDLRTLGLVNTIPLTSLHRIVRDNAPLMSAISMVEKMKQKLE